MPEADVLDRLERLRIAAEDRAVRYAERFDAWSDAAFDAQPALIAVARAARRWYDRGRLLTFRTDEEFETAANLLGDALDDLDALREEEA